jgi:hypothetical protein
MAAVLCNGRFYSVTQTNTNCISVINGDVSLAEFRMIEFIAARQGLQQVRRQFPDPGRVLKVLLGQRFDRPGIATYFMNESNRRSQ